MNNHVVVTADPKQSLDRRAEHARARALQQLAYYFTRAIPDLDQHGEAELDMAELTDAILEAAVLRILAKLQATDDTRVPRLP